MNIKDLLRRGEGCLPHMYLDTVGKVTVGVGNMLPNVTAAQELPFVLVATGNLATPEEVEADFIAVAQQEPGRWAPYYKQFTKCILTDEEIDRLLERRILGFTQGLQQVFHDYNEMPEKARAGIMDMAFNLGVSGLVNKFPSFTRGVRRKDWALCAAECKRKGISDERNEEVRKLFESVAEETQ